MKYVGPHGDHRFHDLAGPSPIFGALCFRPSRFAPRARRKQREHSMGEERQRVLWMRYARHSWIDRRAVLRSLFLCSVAAAWRWRALLSPKVCGLPFFIPRGSRSACVAVPCARLEPAAAFAPSEHAAGSPVFEGTRRTERETEGNLGWNEVLMVSVAARVICFSRVSDHSSRVAGKMLKPKMRSREQQTTEGELAAGGRARLIFAVLHFFFVIFLFC